MVDVPVFELLYGYSIYVHRNQRPQYSIAEATLQVLCVHIFVLTYLCAFYDILPTSMC